MYDSVCLKGKNGKDIEIQFKNGECLVIYYEVGSKIELPDGIYYGYEGAFVVFKEVVVAAFEKMEGETFMFDKWGGKIDIPEINRWK